MLDNRILKNTRSKSAALYVVRVAFMSALLTALKFALSFIPNVEVVTLLILVYASVFGLSYALPASLVFCATELAVYGAGSWVLLYFAYWPLLAVVASLVLKKHRLWAAVSLAAVGCVIFGALSACSDTLFYAIGLSSADLGAYWVAYYVRGLGFDFVHLTSSSAIVCFLYLPMVKTAERIKRADIVS